MRPQLFFPQSPRFQSLRPQSPRFQLLLRFQSPPRFPSRLPSPRAHSPRFQSPRLPSPRVQSPRLPSPRRKSSPGEPGRPFPSPTRIGFLVEPKLRATKSDRFPSVRPGVAAPTVLPRDGPRLMFPRFWRLASNRWLALRCGPPLCVRLLLDEKLRSAKFRDSGEPPDRTVGFPDELRPPPGEAKRPALPRSIDRPRLPAEKSRMLGEREIELGLRLSLIDERPPEPEKLRTLGVELRLGAEKLRELEGEPPDRPPRFEEEKPRMLGAEPRDIDEPLPLRDTDGPPPRDEKLRLPPPPPPIERAPPPPPPLLRPPLPPPRLPPPR